MLLNLHKESNISLNNKARKLSFINLQLITISSIALLQLRDISQLFTIMEEISI